MPVRCKVHKYYVMLDQTELCLRDDDYHGQLLPLPACAFRLVAAPSENKTFKVSVSDRRGSHSDRGSTT